ncbi:fumarylacetoacetate hydrolase family protein [Pseudomonas sp. PP3]|uniref:fumarylacetoacetate hydrolase family protein n=1 Tax=Pseudomonas sp. PP3 TaxID=2815936 RepID=UPI001BAFD437|nr:fumarylacetoacetate hydrolase family protein [Pseudomonas sp. PP3]
MKLVRFGAKGEERPAILGADGFLRDLSEHVTDIDASTLSADKLAKIAALNVEELPVVQDDSVRLGPPVKIGKIICIGLNYTDHAAEVKLPLPTEPTIFMKGCHPTGAFDSVTLPKGSEKGDWEVELGIVIGKRGLYIDTSNALEHVAGYCVVNDLSERSYQMDRGGQWTKGKSFPGFAPVGPWLVTADEVPDSSSLSIWLAVNGHRYQDGNTRNLVFDVPAVVSYVSNFYQLEAGDLIITGTPAGVGLGQNPPVFLKPGDVVTAGIEGLGSQRLEIRGWKE